MNQPKRGREMLIEYFFKEAMQGINNLDNITGPELNEYVEVMAKISEAVNQRLEIAKQRIKDGEE